MYGPGSIRGFNPQSAGNVRLDGLYFDQQGGLSNRVVEGSTIRVGVGEIGYAFPAPTGIVDYELRRTGDGKPSGSIVASAGPFEARGLSADAVVPLVGKELQVPIGVSYQISTQTPYSANPGYTSSVTNLGATPEWSINDQWRVRLIFDWTRVAQAQTLPVVFTAGDFEPPRIPHVYFGQNWAQAKTFAENYGAIVHGQLSEHWSLATGLFRSISDNPVSFSDLYVNTRRNGLSDHLLIAYPDQYVGSTSGEVRITGRFSLDSWIHHIVLLVRGRDTLARYGGADTVDVGTALVGQGITVPEPDFQYSGRVSDRTRLLSTGIAWRGQWQGRADFSLGLQKESYNKAVTPPGGVEARLEDRPLRAYGQASYAISERVTAYAGATQGLEDSGTAPTGSVNHGAILPTARTWQVDTGARFTLTTDVKLVAGVFEIEKPYFNLDTGGYDRQLAVQRAKGMEFSLAGAIGKDFHLTAGALLGEVSVLGAGLQAEGIGPFAFGQPHFQSAINADYAFTPAISADLGVFRFGTAPVSIDDRLQQPKQTFVSIGGRYKFTIGKDAASLRVQMQNATNYYLWNFVYTPGFMQFSGRSEIAYLTIDI
jgi:iron complex outermembrane receptor protein